jgi:tRNA(fMet)-specific endonuclease VapC
MSGRYLLDTNIVVALFAGDSTLLDRAKEADEVFVPCFVIGELYYGARRSIRVEDNVARIDEFAANNVVLACDVESARLYGEVKGKLRQKGRPIPENNIWIAATALQHKLTLISRDVHFNEVEGLIIETW